MDRRSGDSVVKVALDSAALGAPVTAAGDRTGARILVFDLARGLAVAFMLLVHATAHFGVPEIWASPLGGAIAILGGPLAAPVFMVLMGASLAFSGRSSPAAVARRGLWLLALAYTLNVLRGTLPASIGLATGHVTTEQLAPYSPATLLTMVDIHQMAGLSLLTIAALPWLRRRPAAALGLAAAVVLVAPVLWGRATGLGPLDAALATLWGTDWNVFFPLFPWLAYPLVGLALGSLLARAADRERFIRQVGGLGLGLGLLGLGLIVTVSPVEGVGGYWRQGPGAVLAIVGLVLVWLAVCQAVAARLPANRILDGLYGWSGRVTSIYCVHWILIGWGVGLVGHRQLEAAPLLAAIVILAILSDRLTLAHPRLAGRAARMPALAGSPAGGG